MVLNLVIRNTATDPGIVVQSIFSVIEYTPPGVYICDILPRAWLTNVYHQALQCSLVERNQ